MSSQSTPTDTNPLQMGCVSAVLGWVQFTGVLILYVLLLELAANQYVAHSNIRFKYLNVMQL